MKIGILISGSGSNMIKLIESCQNNENASINIVISNNPDAKGIEFAKSKNIKTKIINHKEFSEREDFDNQVNNVLIENKIDFLCNAGFMRIHGEKFVKKWFNKHLNIHPALLPSFKGLNTHERAIKSGVKYAGCTVHLVRSGVDEGPIIGQAVTSVDPHDDKDSLAEKVLKLEHKLYPKCLKLFIEELVKVKNDKVIFSDKAIKVLEDFKV
jgi:phosphoribosylglycinamide formyltransferase-1